MRSLAKIGLILLYVAAFFVITALLGNGHSYLTAESYGQGATPKSMFPVVAVRQSEPKSTGAQYQLMRWSEIEKNRRSASPLTFKLQSFMDIFSCRWRANFSLPLTLR